MKKRLLVALGLALLIGSFASAGPTAAQLGSSFFMSSISCGGKGC
jgi:hypothetical protein